MWSGSERLSPTCQGRFVLKPETGMPELSMLGLGHQYKVHPDSIEELEDPPWHP